MKVHLLQRSISAFALLAMMSMACVPALFGGCASHKPKSSARIIMEGERSPFITDKPERAGETVREAWPR